MKQAKATLKAFTTHCSGARPAWVSAPIPGRATAVPEIDIGTTNTARSTAARVTVRSRRPFVRNGGAVGDVVCVLMGHNSRLGPAG
ncbi:hypothetical protein GCM10010425_06560 [Streptomyces spororaveus]|uniref:Uncharacterized protein n=1 Tax=Streptomyces spororaveus TaxID=284039 RepID=A0ABQ3TF11_9ACTN|nr:hypothetical protein Sspor_45750 [Streptomyces spororaveus]